MLTRGDLTPDELEEFEERAAIIEFDAGMRRSAAERAALEEIERKRKTEGTPCEL